MIRVAIYVRVSTQEQAKEGYSIAEQTERLSLFAKAQDWNIYRIYTDAGCSGASLDRPALQDMIRDVRSGLINKVLVYKLDRLSRSQKDTLQLIEDVFLAHGCDFESMTEKLDTGTPNGRMFLGILAAFAQLEREVIKERMQLGIEARIKEGKWRGGKQVPFGYDYDPDAETLVINPYQSMIIKTIFNQYTTGTGITMIRDHLIESGMYLSHGSVTIRSLRYILRNKTYCGYQKHGDQWIPALHAPIIDESTYDKAQILLDASSKRYRENKRTEGMAYKSACLSGLIYCARCGGKYSKNQTGCARSGYHMNYTCYSRHKKVKSMIKDPNCKNRSYRMEVLDNIIFDEIKKLALDPEYVHMVKHPDPIDADAIEHQIKAISNQISRLLDLYSTGRYSTEDLDAKTAPLMLQRNKLENELSKQREKMPDAEVIKLAGSFTEALEHGTTADKRQIILALIDKIVIDGENITIHWNFA